MTSSLVKLKANHPWPDVEHIKGEYFSLDGGGRHLVTDLIEEHSVELMLEIGCFLCGSSIQWLEASPTLTLVGLDPWKGPWHETLKRYYTDKIMKPTFKKIDNPEAFIDSLEKYGSFAQALANAKQFKDRFIPVKGSSPEDLPYLKESGVNPQLIYIDSVKHREDLDEVYAQWPDAILCGDDWTWNAAEDYPMRRAVESFVDEHGFKVQAEKATWVIHKT